MRFEKIETRQSNDSGSSNFVRLNDGESITGVLRGEVYRFFQVWPQGGQKQIYSEPTPGASMRFKVNLVVMNDDKKTFRALVWEFGIKVNNQLAAYSEEMDLSKTKIKISRSGTGKSNTQWLVIPLGTADAKALKAISETPLNVLNTKTEEEPF